MSRKHRNQLIECFPKADESGLSEKSENGDCQTIPSANPKVIAVSSYILLIPSIPSESIIPVTRIAMTIYAIKAVVASICDWSFVTRSCSLFWQVVRLG